MHGWRPELESALCLNLPRLLKQRLLVPGCIKSGSLHWTNSYTKQEVASVGFRAELHDTSGTLVLNYRAEGQPEECAIRLSSIPNHYGGRNWFMHCPSSGRRARCLYKWPGLVGFRHREAVHPKPTYASQRDSGMERVTRQRWALRRRMGDTISDLTREPFKPKWMRWATFNRYAARDAKLEEQDARYMAAALARMGVAGWNQRAG